MLSYVYKVATLEDGAILVWLIYGAWGSTPVLIRWYADWKTQNSTKAQPEEVAGGLSAALLGRSF